MNFNYIVIEISLRKINSLTNDPDMPRTETNWDQADHCHCNRASKQHGCQMSTTDVV